FDEPLSNLDAKLRVQMRLEIRRLHQRLKATSIFVTHDQVEAMTLADTVVVMSKGEIQQVGTPTDVYRRPRTTFVATFIGSPAMNVLPGRVVAPGRVEVAEGGTLPFDAGEFPVAAGTAVQVGVRPEEWSIAAGGREGLTFTREFVEELGATRLVHGTIGKASAVVAIPSGQHDPGQSAFLSASADAVALFDTATGITLRRT
ncbi:MAG: sn-glycerol-3-phosphate ABC transporter ATP-binding protein UgpC, partial [Beijerinckiaceae bacterium]